MEVDTAKRVIDYFEGLGIKEIITDIGGTGFAVCFGTKNSGKTIVIRSELDAIPIQEPKTLEYHSVHAGVSHKCGHDGHMAILALVGKKLSEVMPVSGRVVLVFQPAEETGDGARAVVADPKFTNLNPDYIFALHNVPSFPMGEVIIKPGTFCCASQGQIIRLHGKPAHAAQPETGISPVAAVAELLSYFENLPELINTQNSSTFATVVGVRVGEEAFGVAASEAEIYVTLRAETDLEMAEMTSLVASKVEILAEKHQLQYQLSTKDRFNATQNHIEAVDLIKESLVSHRIHQIKQPFRWSEDFGAFTQHYTGAIFGLGAGEETPALHDIEYDFPDYLIEIGAGYFIKIIQHCLK
jgi:amidohydrolase